MRTPRPTLRLGLAFAFALVMTVGVPPSVAQTMTVTLLGTGDPTPRLDRFGPSTLVQAGDEIILIDAGRGAMMRLYALGVSTAEIDAIFLTHLHSDHVIGLADLLMTGWVVDGRRAPLRIYGPPGTKAMMKAMRDSFKFDIDIRAREARRDPEGVDVDVVEFDDGFVWRESGLTVTAFAVDHEPVKPAYGYRLDYEGLSAAFSGDTKPSEKLVEEAKGVDLLVHEVADAPAPFKESHPGLPRLAHHTQAADAGKVFAATSPKLAVYSHLVLAGGLHAEELIPLTRQTYDGPLIVGEDMTQLRIDPEGVSIVRPGEAQ